MVTPQDDGLRGEGVHFPRIALRLYGLPASYYANRSPHKRSVMRE